MKPAVFLDRDNTLIHNDGDLGDPDQVRLMQGAAAAIASLRGLGYRVIVVTNQGGVARGKYGEKDVLAVHDRICQLLHEAANGTQIDAFYYCPYHPQGRLKQYKKEHPNRKPQPGMLLEAAQDLDIDLGQSWTVGDQMRDVQAGAAAGTRTVLIREDADRLSPLDVADLPGVEQLEGSGPLPRPDFMATSIVEAVRIIAQQRKPESSADVHQPPVVKKWDAAAVARLQRARPKRPADELAQGQGKDPKARATPQFRPWNAPEPRKAHAGEPLEKQRPSRMAESAPPPVSTPASTSTLPPSPTPSPAPTSMPQASPPPRGAGPDSGDSKTLRLILQELRAQRGGDTDLSYLKTFAIVLQMVAVICLVGGLWMGAGDTDLFLRWALAGVMVQLATIACLLYAR